jgi:hypothetical protein
METFKVLADCIMLEHHSLGGDVNIQIFLLFLLLETMKTIDGVHCNSHLLEKKKYDK